MVRAAILYVVVDRARRVLNFCVVFRFEMSLMLPLPALDRDDG